MSGALGVIPTMVPMLQITEEPRHGAAQQGVEPMDHHSSRGHQATRPDVADGHRGRQEQRRMRGAQPILGIAQCHGTLCVSSSLGPIIACVSSGFLS
jgi:hypothetical protein